MTTQVNPVLANTMLLAEHDEEMQRKIIDSIEKIVAQYIGWNTYTIGADIVAQQSQTIERMALRALKNHLNNSANFC
jgi:regulator of RNase E activity RraB